MRIGAITIIVSLACASVASAQTMPANPYKPPAPGWVLVQPCGQESGWVPPTHPLAASPLGHCQPAPDAPDPSKPWTLAPQLPLEIGKLYTNPYGLILHVVSATVSYALDEDTGTVKATVVLGLMYQSRTLYERREHAMISHVSLEEPRSTWWEVPK